MRNLVFSLNAIISFSFSLLLGCAGLHAPPSPEQLAAWQAQQAQAQQLKHWQLNAHFAITSESEAWSARVYWQQQLEQYTLRFTAPLGQGVLRLQGNAQGVQLTTAKQTLYADSPEQLLSEATAVNIPVSYLRFWIRGLPAPDVTHELRLTPQGQLDWLQQADWTVTYQDYQTVQEMALPHKLFLHNDEYQAKIVISQWQLTKTLSKH